MGRGLDEFRVRFQFKVCGRYCLLVLNGFKEFRKGLRSVLYSASLGAGLECFQS